MSMFRRHILLVYQRVTLGCHYVSWSIDYLYAYPHSYRDMISHTGWWTDLALLKLKYDGCEFRIHCWECQICPFPSNMMVKVIGHLDSKWFQHLPSLTHVIESIALFSNKSCTTNRMVDNPRDTSFLTWPCPAGFSWPMSQYASCTGISLIYGKMGSIDRIPPAGRIRNTGITHPYILNGIDRFIYISGNFISIRFVIWLRYMNEECSHGLTYMCS